MTRVLQDIKDDTAAASLHNSSKPPLSHPSNPKMKDKAKGLNGLGINGANGNGVNKGGVGGRDKEREREKEKFVGKGEGGVSLALPRAVVEEGVRITRECLEEVCVVPSSESDGSGDS